MYGKRLRSLDLFSLENMRLRGDLIAVYKFLTRGRGGADTHLFTLVTRNRTQGNVTKRSQNYMYGVVIGIKGGNQQILELHIQLRPNIAITAKFCPMVEGSTLLSPEE
ncbi:hypothetical protein WISP_08996 [Willisornis vidua]|uniref:Uncharacterized protein n=1 Tax=Willisornis vidua TaxID=1566151 RepID=A0ABQ9DXB1_9PASS|nr:hypothetical protein WISP_08996 [Willisornis vidua]